MTDREKILMFEKFLRDRGLKEDIIYFNILAVKLLSSEVLRYFNQSLESIDTYSFEEFTDMVGLIDRELGGRDGIVKMMDAMMNLTDFLKENKMIKGGKIAHYKRMFSDIDYYLDKYDMMTGKKDDSKEFIKNVTGNRFSSKIIRIVEDVNVYDFKTLDLIDRILNDVPFDREEYQEEVPFVVSILMDLDLLEMKNGVLEATKKGRGISRLAAEDRYGAIIYLLFYNVNWRRIIESFYKDSNFLDFEDILNIFSSIYRRDKECIINLNKVSELSKEELILEVATSKFRLMRIDSVPYGQKVIDICFIGMGLIEVIQEKEGELVYRVSDFGQEIFKLVYEETTSYIKDRITSISNMIKNKNFELAEKNILNFLGVFGGNTVIWDYFGQLLLLKRSYKLAYEVLKNGYESSTKRGRASKSLLYHLVLCCRKLKYTNDTEIYEQKLQTMDRA